MPLPFDEPLADALDAWQLRALAAGLTERTIDARLSTIRRLVRDGVDPLTADTETLERWMAELPIGRGSKATYRGHLIAWFKWLADTGRREDDPSARLPVVKVPRGIPHPLTPEQVEQVLARCSDVRMGWTRAYIILAAYGGLRAHEIAKVRGEDVRGAELVIHGKGGKTSTVPLTPVIARLAESMPRSGYWFPTNSATGHVHRCSVSSAIRRAFDRVGVSEVPHSLRHFYCTQVLRATGGDLRTTQRLARHSTPATTAIYTQVLDDAAARAAASIPGAA